MTAIEWTDCTWNVVVGCSRVSAGCMNCYAERVAHRGMSPQHKGLTRLSSKGPQWTGEVRFLPGRLAEPLSWKKPRRVFVNSMSDLFHESLTNEQIAAVFGVMAACQQHTFQVLTKRPRRMVEWFSVEGAAARVDLFKHIALAGRIDEYFAPERLVTIDGWPGYWVTSKGRVLSDRKGERKELSPMAGESGHSRVMLYRGEETSRPLIHRLVLSAFDSERDERVQGCHIDGDATNNAFWNLRWGDQSSNWDDSKRHGTRRRYCKLTIEQADEIRTAHADGVSGAELGRRYGISDTQARNIASGTQWTSEPSPAWPLPGVWLGVSCENQETADERIPLLLQTPAAVRFVSAEPLLGPIDFSIDAELAGHKELYRVNALTGRHTDMGRPCRDVPKLGWIIVGGESGPRARACHLSWMHSIVEQCGRAGVPCFVKQLGARVEVTGQNLDVLGGRGPLDGDWANGALAMLNHGKGGDPGEWPEELRVREFPR